MSGAEKVVTSAETLVAAVADSGIEQIVVSGRLTDVPLIRLAPGQSLRGADESAAISFRAADDGVQLSTDNSVRSIRLNASPEKRAICNDTTVPTLGRIELRGLTTTGRVQILGIPLISRIACVPKIILGLTSSEITRERSDPAAQAGNCPLRHLTQIGLELAKRHLDRVQIRGILRQITKDGATRFNRFAHACCLVCRKVVHDHGVVTPQSWSQVVLHIIEERLSLHSPVNYIWRCHSLAA